MAVAILQARMSSSRLPGKVMMPLAGRPMVERQIERLRRCETLTRLIVATSVEASDDPLAAHLQTLGVEVFRGPLADVLGRYVACVEALDIQGDVVRLTADCPLTDPGVIDAGVRLRERLEVDYVSNGRIPTWPRGLDMEVFTLDALLAAGREARDLYDREHVTPYLYKEGSRFTVAALTQGVDESALRWTVDTPDDYAFVARVYDALYPANPRFTSADVRALPFQRYEREA
ncbi:glycosyltransferase family protein [Phenylobacterium sp. J367]|uniref:glycosyltransferase family protein n=1 Tax=Phenylobacterium sp. J367 TaxID=2898435 RepID=UPI002151E13A|nr:glycosyltransferase family protein [Phenylobacterium sp. J367]MCR5878706.1 glycosyltransferase family protein [Phenylobacterium sp. J367]